MKDRYDKKTQQLDLRTPSARRQSAYAERQRALGRKQVSMWVTVDEEAQMRALLATLRGEKDEG